MSRRALVETATGIVKNVVELLDKDESDWVIPTGQELVTSDVANPGDTWDGNNFIKPAPPVPTREDELHDKIYETDNATLAEVREYIREKGL